MDLKEFPHYLRAHDGWQLHVKVLVPSSHVILDEDPAEIRVLPPSSEGGKGIKAVVVVGHAMMVDSRTVYKCVYYCIILIFIF